jgi:hypothetical protein
MSPEDKVLQNLEQRDHVFKHSVCMRIHNILRWVHEYN